VPPTVPRHRSWSGWRAARELSGCVQVDQLIDQRVSCRGAGNRRRISSRTSPLAGTDSARRTSPSVGSAVRSPEPPAAPALAHRNSRATLGASLAVRMPARGGNRRRTTSPPSCCDSRPGLCVSRRHSPSRSRPGRARGDRLPDHRLEDRRRPHRGQSAGEQRIDRAANCRAGQRRVARALTAESIWRGPEAAARRREKPGQRPRLEIRAAALLRDSRRATQPPRPFRSRRLHRVSSTPQWGHEFRGRRGRRESLENGQRRNADEPRLEVCGGAPDHASIVTDAPYRRLRVDRL